RGQRIDDERGLVIVEQIAAALAFAHRQGVAHGDVDADAIVFDAEDNAYLGGFAIDAGEPSAASEDVLRFAALVPRMVGHDMPAALAAVVDDAAVATGAVPAEAFVDAVRAGRGTRGTAEAPGPDDARNPYRGLRPFGEADARDFFGRVSAVAGIV